MKSVVQIFAVLILLLKWHITFSQQERKFTRDGNKFYLKENYTEAEVSYRKALERVDNMPEAAHNLGNTLYNQSRWEEAAKQFALSSKTNPAPDVRAKALHNLGNTYLEQEKYEDAVKAYKQALKINPTDRDTKYNLAYANAKLKKQQQEGGSNNQQQNQENQQDQNKQEQNKDENKNENKQQQDSKQNDKKDGKEQQQKQQEAGLSKEEAEKILQGLQGEELKTNQKMQEKMMKGVPVKIEKDW